jgi:hypothetical protein
MEQTPDATPAPDGDDAVPPDAVYAIPRSLAQATVDYLSMQPYREVYALVRGFEALERISVESGPDSA